MAKTKTYDGESLTIRYDVARCIHAAECVRGHRGVFDPARRPWVDPDAGAVEEVMAVIERCPTGALSYQRQDGGQAEQPPGQATVRVAPDGPLYARGDLRPAGEESAGPEIRAAWCRCGQSQNKPYCDDSHLAADFRDPGQLGTTGATSGPGHGPVEVRAATDGPLLVTGTLRIEGPEGALWVSKAAFCRCGASKNKPFCDGSHKEVGFRG